MASFSDLPPELILYMWHHLDFADVKSLSSLNSRFQSILAPRIFRTLRFTNLEEDEQILSSAISRHESCIKSLHFEFWFLGDTQKLFAELWRSDGDSHRPDDISGNENPGRTKLSDLALQILSGQVLSHVNRLTITFSQEDIGFCAIGWDCTFRMGRSMRMYAKSGIARMWTVLCCNQKIISLELGHLPALPMSSWRKPEWPAFLSQLKALTLRLEGGYHAIRSNEKVINFLTKMDSHFFEHTKSLRKLHLKASPPSYIWDSDLCASPIALRPGQVPELEELQVENYFIDENFCTFIEDATSRLPSSHLRKLELLECRVIGNTTSWAKLFACLSTTADGREPSLEELVVANEFVAFRADYASRVPHLPVTFRHIGTRVCVRSSPEQDVHGIRPFAYGRVWDGSGILVADKRRNAEEFESGADMKSYRELMRLVARNAERAADCRSEAQ